MGDIPDCYEFFSPVKIVSGRKALLNLPFELSQLGAQKPLVVTDKGVVQAGLVKFVRNAFDGSGMRIGAIFDEVPPDSSIDVVRRAAETFRENGCDSLVALEGRVADPGKSLKDYWRFMGWDP